MDESNTTVQSKDNFNALRVLVKSSIEENFIRKINIRSIAEVDNNKRLLVLRGKNQAGMLLISNSSDLCPFIKQKWNVKNMQYTYEILIIQDTCIYSDT